VYQAGKNPRPAKGGKRVEYYIISFNKYGEMSLATVSGGKITYPIERAVEGVHEIIKQLNSSNITGEERVELQHMKRRGEEKLERIFRLRREIEELYAQGRYKEIFGKI